MNTALAGLGFVGLGLMLIRPKEKASSPSERTRQQRISKNRAKFLDRHRHAFSIDGKRFVTVGTFFDPQNPRLHTHFLSVPVSVEGQRPGSLRVVTSFDPFGLRHVHTAKIRDSVFTSGGPF